jgi:multiple sugar transport system substrate-binding protein
MSAHHRQLSRRRLLQLAGSTGAAALVASGIAACGSDSGGGSSATLRFMFWGSDDRVQRFQRACALFNERNPDIRVAPEFGAIDAIRTKTTVAMSSRNLPDVLWVLGDLFPQMVAEGHLTDLTPHLDAAGGISTEGFSDSVMAPGMRDGRQYAMTHGIQSVGLFAKRNVLDELGIPVKQYPDAYSWDEYARYCSQIHAAKGADFYGTDDPNYAGAPNFFRAYARQNGQELWTENGDLGFTRELLTTWLEYWKRMRDTMAAVPTALALEQNPYFEGAPMIRGLSAFHMRNSNQMLELRGLTPDPLVLMPVPGNGGEGNTNIALDPNTLGIAANTEHPEAALKFVDFLLNDEERATIIGTTIGGPPTQRIRDAITPTISEAEAQFLSYISFEASAPAKPVPSSLPTAGAFQTDLSKAIENLAYDRATVAQTVDVVFGDLRAKLLAK